MEIIQFSFGDHLEERRDMVLCLGYFDGVHLGHQYLIEQAKKEGYKVGVFTFDNSPAFVLGNIKENHFLTSISDKAEILQELAVDFLYIMHFDIETVKYTKDEFINGFLKPLNPMKLICGPDYRFGVRGEGNPEYLKYFFDVKTVPLLEKNGEKVASRRIAQLIEQGNMQEACQLLTRPYTVNGLVVSGYRNGHKINLPTANLELSYPYVFPKQAVYMGYALIGGKKHKCVINVGTHPTIDQLSKPIIEVHILDFQENIYGKDIFVEFIELIREQERFDSLEELKEQIEKDKQIAKKSLH